MAPSKSVATPDLEKAQAKTLGRLNEIRNHFAASASAGKLRGKVAVITGAGSEMGIGRATATFFAKEGAKRLYVLDFNVGTLPEFSKELEKKFPGVKVTSIEADAADETAVESVCNLAIKEEGRLDVFFANAGIVGAHLLSATEPDEFMEMMRVNTLSCFLAVKHASEAMKLTGKDKKASGGSIILTASVAGLRFGAGPMDYSASKAAVVSLGQTAANTLHSTNIRVNCVLPGLIETGMTTYTFERARERGTLGKVGQLNPTRRYGVAEEIAAAVLFLASDDASYVNGAVIPVDGGLSSSLPVVPGQMF